MTALAGSCWSSCGSTRNSRDRWLVRARAAFAPTAWEVLRPQDVPVLMPAVIDVESEVPVEVLVSRLTEPVKSPNGPAPPAWLRPRPRLRPAVSLTETESLTESAVPIVLV
jgi:hypothetical protein